jgi:GT2 family glycosyltransferase
MDKLVSVIIPSYNDGDILPRAVKSALMQRHLLELIIVNDCSTDDSLSVSERLCDLDPRMAVFSTPSNGGPAAARNYGASFARGHYLSFLDTDDEYLAHFLETTVAMLETAQGMHAVKTGVQFVGEDGRPLLDPSDPRVEALTFSIPNNMLILRESFEAMGGFPTDPVFRREHAGEDVAFNKAVAKYLQPLGRIEKVGYRFWNKKDSHLERFLSNTRVVGGDFEFIQLSEDQKPGGALDNAINAYLEEVSNRLGL